MRDRLFRVLLAGVTAASVAIIAGCVQKPPPRQTVANDLHYKCYALDDPPPVKVEPVTIHNQFTKMETVPIVAPINLCLPVIKNDHGLLDATDLKCYRISGRPADARVRLVSEQFGTEELSIQQALALCTPANTSLGNQEPPQTIVRNPHYVCYLVSGSVAPKHAPVNLKTRTFPPEERVEIGPPVSLCVPSLKNFRGGGEEAEKERMRLEANFPHLKCYRIAGPAPGLTVNLRTQFPIERGLKVGAPQALCVPVKKTVI